MLTPDWPKERSRSGRGLVVTGHVCLCSRPAGGRDDKCVCVCANRDAGTVRNTRLACRPPASPKSLWATTPGGIIIISTTHSLLETVEDVALICTPFLFFNFNFNFLSCNQINVNALVPLNTMPGESGRDVELI